MEATAIFRGRSDEVLNKKKKTKKQQKNRRTTNRTIEWSRDCDKDLNQ